MHAVCVSLCVRVDCMRTCMVSVACLHCRLLSGMFRRAGQAAVNMRAPARRRGRRCAGRVGVGCALLAMQRKDKDDQPRRTQTHLYSQCFNHLSLLQPSSHTTTAVTPWPPPHRFLFRLSRPFFTCHCLAWLRWRGWCHHPQVLAWRAVSRLGFTA